MGISEHELCAPFRRKGSPDGSDTTVGYFSRSPTPLGGRVSPAAVRRPRSRGSNWERRQFYASQQGNHKKPEPPHAAAGVDVTKVLAAAHETPKTLLSMPDDHVMATLKVLIKSCSISLQHSAAVLCVLSALVAHSNGGKVPLMLKTAFRELGLDIRHTGLFVLLAALPSGSALSARLSAAGRAFIETGVITRAEATELSKNMKMTSEADGVTLHPPQTIYEGATVRERAGGGVAWLAALSSWGGHPRGHVTITRGDTDRTFDQKNSVELALNLAGCFMCSPDCPLPQGTDDITVLFTQCGGGGSSNDHSHRYMARFVVYSTTDDLGALLEAGIVYSAGQQPSIRHHSLNRVLKSVPPTGRSGSRRNPYTALLRRSAIATCVPPSSWFTFASQHVVTLRYVATPSIAEPWLRISLNKASMHYPKEGAPQVFCVAVSEPVFRPMPDSLPGGACVDDQQPLGDVRSTKLFG